jgi:hypothetical protein
MRCERGQTAAEYMGLLVVVAAIVAALAAADIHGQIVAAVGQAVCVSFSDDPQDNCPPGEERFAGGGERLLAENAVGAASDAVCGFFSGECVDGRALKACVESSVTRTSKANVLVAVVRVDKDSTLIRKDFSDETSEFVILDGTQAAGELFAGVRGQVADTGIDYSLSGQAGLRLAGAQVYKAQNPAEANAFQDGIQAAGGLDGVLRDIAELDNTIPVLNIPNPVGYLNDLPLDLLGVDSDGDLPEPDGRYQEAEAFLQQKGNVSGGAGGVDAGIKELIRAAGTVKVVSSGDAGGAGQAGDVEVALQVDASLAGELGVATLGASGGAGASFTATLKLDAQDGYRPSSVEFTGLREYSGEASLGAGVGGEDVADVARTLRDSSVGGTTTSGSGRKAEFKAELPLAGPENRENLAATLELLSGAAQPARAAARMIERIDEDATIEVATLDTTADSTDGEVKVGLGVGGGGGASSSTQTADALTRLIRYPGENLEPRLCKRPPG